MQFSFIALDVPSLIIRCAVPSSLYQTPNFSDTLLSYQASLFCSDSLFTQSWNAIALLVLGMYTYQLSPSVLSTSFSSSALSLSDLTSHSLFLMVKTVQPNKIFFNWKPLNPQFHALSILLLLVSQTTF